MINEEIYEIFKEFKIYKDDGILALLSLYYNLNSNLIPNELKQKLNTTGIYTLDKYGVLQWKVQLFEGQQTAFEWVKLEYCSLFKEANPNKGGKIKEATTLMKKFFSLNPEVRKDDVLGATRMYLRATNPEYIRFPNYFIQKGIGADKTSDLTDWLEKYKASQEVNTERVLTNKLQ